MLNKKGFTIIELIVSFVFVSILSISLFSLIINYRNRALDNEVELSILSYISKVKIDIQKDIDNKLLNKMEYCMNGAEIMEQCIVLTFGDNTTKTFRIGYNFEVEKITNKAGETIDEFSFKLPFISYGGIKYEIPDAHNVKIRHDFMLESTRIDDALETNTPLYKINVIFSHKDLVEDIVFRIVANGTMNLTNGVTPPYKSYNIGDIVTMQLNPNDRRRFRVIKNSSGYNSTLILLYDDVALNRNTNFNLLEHGNEYAGSHITTYFVDLKNTWRNARIVRPITADEIAFVTNVCPQFREINSLNVGLATTHAWITSSSYWTSSKKEYNTTNQGKVVWFVNGASKQLEARRVDIVANNSIRPVIEISKIYDITT